MLWITGLAVLVLAVIFAAQNAGPVSVAFFSWQADASLAVVAILCFACGAVAAAILMLPGVIRHKLAARNHQGKIASLESMNKDLRRAMAGPESRTSDEPEPLEPIDE